MYRCCKVFGGATFFVTRRPALIPLSPIPEYKGIAVFSLHPFLSGVLHGFETPPLYLNLHRGVGQIVGARDLHLPLFFGISISRP